MILPARGSPPFSAVLALLFATRLHLGRPADTRIQCRACGLGFTALSLPRLVPSWTFFGRGRCSSSCGIGIPGNLYRPGPFPVSVRLAPLLRAMMHSSRKTFTSNCRLLPRALFANRSRCGRWSAALAWSGYCPISPWQLKQCWVSTCSGGNAERAFELGRSASAMTRRDRHPVVLGAAYLLFGTRSWMHEHPAHDAGDAVGRGKLAGVFWRWGLCHFSLFWRVGDLIDRLPAGSDGAADTGSANLYFTNLLFHRFIAILAFLCLAAAISRVAVVENIQPGDLQAWRAGVVSGLPVAGRVFVDSNQPGRADALGPRSRGSLYGSHRLMEGRPLRRCWPVAAGVPAGGPGMVDRSGIALGTMVSERCCAATVLRQRTGLNGTLWKVRGCC